MVGSTMAVVLFGASALAPAATAQTIPSTQAQIATLQAEVIAGATRVHALTVEYQQSNVQSQVLSQQVAADQAEIAHLQQQVAGSANVLRQQAIASYTGLATNSPTNSALRLGLGKGDPSVQAEYLQVAAGDINDAVDQYRSQLDQLTSAEQNLAAQQQASRAAANATIQSRQAALAEAVAEQSRLNQLEQQLGQLEEAAVIERQHQAAATAAAAAAQAQAATQGLPINNGIISVVHTIVSPTAPPAPPETPGYQPLGGQWLQLRECESSDNYQANTGNGFYGAYQFTESTWTGLGFPGRPDLESPQMQDQAAVKDQSMYGWGQWPACSAALGLH
jgi:hypothetical protein